MSHFSSNEPPARERVITLAREVAGAAQTLGQLTTATDIRHETDFLAARRRALRAQVDRLSDSELTAWRELVAQERGRVVVEVERAAEQVQLERRRRRQPTFTVTDARARDAEHYRRGR